MENGAAVPTMPPAFDEQAQTWDMPFKGDKAKGKKQLGSDFVEGQAWRRNQNRAYLFDEERGQWELPETLEAVMRLTQRNPDATAKYIEDKANGPAVMQTLRLKLNGIIAILPEQLGGDKIARARSVAPMVEAGQVWLPHPSIASFDVEKFILEVIKFPRGAKDDRVDAMVQLLIMWKARMESVGWRLPAANLQGSGRGVEHVPDTASVVRQRF
jgi:predicted phage terminase large subunit-like protein